MKEKVKANVIMVLEFLLAYRNIKILYTGAILLPNILKNLMKSLNIKGSMASPANVIPIKKIMRSAINVPDISAASPVVNILGITKRTKPPFPANIAPITNNL